MVSVRIYAEQARQVLLEDQIQLIRIHVRVFDDLADLETERQCRRSELRKPLAALLSHPTADVARQGNLISGVSHIRPEVCPARKQRPPGATLSLSPQTLLCLSLGRRLC